MNVARSRPPGATAAARSAACWAAAMRQSMQKWTPGRWFCSFRRARNFRLYVVGLSSPAQQRTYQPRDIRQRRARRCSRCRSRPATRQRRAERRARGGAPGRQERGEMTDEDDAYLDGLAASARWGIVTAESIVARLWRKKKVVAAMAPSLSRRTKTATWGVRMLTTSASGRMLLRVSVAYGLPGP